MGSKDGEPARTAGAFVARGFAVAAVNYRLSQHAVFPAQIEDCKSAVRWLRANAARFAYDPSRVASYGGSAGGHLAAMLGTTGEVKALDVGAHLDQSSRVQAVVDFFGPTDFLQMDAHRLNPRAMVHDTPDSRSRSSSEARSATTRTRWHEPTRSPTSRRTTRPS